MKSNFGGGACCCCCCGVSGSGGACAAVPHCTQNFASSGRLAPPSLHCLTDLLDCPFDKRRGRQSDENAGKRTQERYVDDEASKDKFTYPQENRKTQPTHTRLQSEPQRCSKREVYRCAPDANGERFSGQMPGTCGILVTNPGKDTVQPRETDVWRREHTH